MKKYLAYYENEWPANIAELTAVENKPFIGFLKGEGVLFTVVPKPVADGPWVTFTAEEANSAIGLIKLSTNQTLEYSTDTTTWTNMNTSTIITLPNIGDKVYIRGILSSDNGTSSNYTRFTMAGKIAASGNCNAIWNYEDLNTPLKEYCGFRMFYTCSSLVTAPELPIITVAKGCYQSMFEGCTSLTTAPKVLPATTLADECYRNMFRGCTTLTTAPELPSTTLAASCYNAMFYDCKSLTTAPELPATTLTNHCYQSIFCNCTKLNYITCLATDLLTSYCTYNWVNGVPSTGTFVKHPDMNDWSTGKSGIPEGWNVEDAVL